MHRPMAGHARARSRRRRFRATTVFIFILASFCSNIVLMRADVSAQTASATPPRAVRGFLDLTSVDLQHEFVRLEGEWEFYWAEFIDPNQLATVSQNGAGGDAVYTPMYLNVPGTWKGASGGDASGGERLPGDGYGTFRLRVALPEGSQPLATYVPFVRTAHKLWVNGQPLASQGTVGPTRQSSIPAAGSGIAAIGSVADEALDIVMHVSNFSFRDGGIGRAPLLAEESLLFRDVQRSLTVEIFFIASLLIIGLYHVGIWMIRPRDKHMLYFGLFCLVVAPRTAVIDQAPLTFFFPDLPWELLIKFEYIGFYLGLPMFLLFLRTLYPGEFHRVTVTAIVTVAGLFNLFVLVMPARIHSHALLYFEIFAAAAFVYMTYSMIQSVRRRRDGALEILLGTAFVFSVVIYDMFFFWGWFGSRPLAPMAILGMVIAHSLLLSKQFSDEFDEQRRLTQENEALLATVKRQLGQIKASRRLMHEREERTRRHVAELLHGTMQSRLLAAQHGVRASLRQLTPGSSPSNVEEARRLLAKVSEQIELVNEEDVRRASHLLHPMLLRIGLAPAINSLGERFSQHMDVHVHVGDELTAIDGHGRTGIASSVRLAMYRIVEEALTNALKHGAAKTVDVFLDVVETSAGRTLSAVVHDDGVGMDVDAGGRPTGFGFDMIAARVEELNGAWHVEGSPGRGTRLRVTIPLDERHDATAETGAVNEDDAGGGNAVDGGGWHEFDSREHAR